MLTPRSASRILAKRSFLESRAERRFVRALMTARPSEASEARSVELVEMNSRAKKATFLEKYRQPAA